MARSDRLFRLLQAMRELPAPFTAARLAAETGVSQRSLYRDFDSLRAAGARIEGERDYGYRLIEEFWGRLRIRTKFAHKRRSSRRSFTKTMAWYFGLMSKEAWR